MDSEAREVMDGIFLFSCVFRFVLWREGFCVIGCSDSRTLGGVESSLFGYH